MGKVLFVATVVKNHIMEFHIPYLKMFKEMGWETAVAARNDYENPTQCVIPYCDTYYEIPFERSPLKFGNLQAYKKLKAVIDNEKYDIIHCHTPVGAMLTRLAAIKARKNGTKVIYTAHGFHFYKGAPTINWLLYYPVEKLCSRWTDALITINHEDFELAKKKMHAKKVYYVPGVGIDVDKFANIVVDRDKMRAEIGVPTDAFLLLSVGELNQNKNHETVIRALAQINQKEIHYAIAGRGDLKEHLEKLAAELGVSEQVHLIGFRADVAELYKAADVFVHPSFREGLPVSVMEAMASGLPCVVSKIRGNKDLIADVVGVHLCSTTDEHDYIKAIEKLISDSAVRHSMGMKNAETIQAYDVSAVNSRMLNIYSNAINTGI